MWIANRAGELQLDGEGQGDVADFSNFHPTASTGLRLIANAVRHRCDFSPSNETSGNLRFVTRANARAVARRARTPSPAGSSYGQMRIFYCDSATYRCATVETDLFPARLRRPVPQTNLRRPHVHLYFPELHARTPTYRSIVPNCRPTHG